MRALLDTHAFLWAVLSPGELSARARDTIEDPANAILVSPVSVYEIVLKHRLGKLSSAAAVAAEPEAAIRALEAAEFAITAAHARMAAAFPSAHRDPFDRLLAAQAIVEGMPVVTADPLIARLGASTLW